MALGVLHQCFWCVQPCKDEPYGGGAAARGGRRSAEAFAQLTYLLLQRGERRAQSGWGKRVKLTFEVNQCGVCLCVKGTLVSVLHYAFYFTRDCLRPVQDPVSISDISQRVDSCCWSETSHMSVQVLTHPRLIAAFRLESFLGFWSRFCFFLSKRKMGWKELKDEEEEKPFRSKVKCLQATWKEAHSHSLGLSSELEDLLRHEDRKGEVLQLGTTGLKVIKNPNGSQERYKKSTNHKAKLEQFILSNTEKKTTLQ